MLVSFIEKHIKALRTVIQNRHVIKGMHFHSEKIREDELFFALTTGNQDGHRFIEKAIQNGAKNIILSDEAYLSCQNGINYFLVEDTYDALIALAEAHRHTLMMPLIAITGSNGKTTTKDILHQLLSEGHKVYKTEGNWNNHIGVPFSLLHIDNTYDYAVLELGMNHEGEIDFLASMVRPAVSIITNVGESHIEHLRTTENIARAKGELIPHTSPMGAVVVPAGIRHRNVLEALDDRNLIQLVNGKEGFRAEGIEMTQEGMMFTVEGNTLYVPLKGEHNVQNSLLALFVARSFGYDWKALQKRLATVEVTGMRYQTVETAHQARLINDAYNASPTSVQASVKTFMAETGKKILVLGDMYELGGVSKQKHEEIGLFLNDYADDLHLLVTVGVDAACIHQAYKGESVHFDTHGEAVACLKAYQEEEVVMLFKASRGMKFEEMVNALR